MFCTHKEIRIFLARCSPILTRHRQHAALASAATEEQTGQAQPIRRHQTGHAQAMRRHQVGQRGDIRRPRDDNLANTWDLDTDSGVTKLLASIGRQLVVVPANRIGLVSALRTHREASRLGVLDVPLLVSDTAQLCAHVKVPCAHTTQCTEPRGSFARVLCAKLFALARLFASGADVFVIDSDAAVMSAEPFRLWRGPLLNASMICQEDVPFFNTGMMRVQHVSPLADMTVGWLLEEWLHRVRLVSNVTGHCGGCDQGVLNELVSGTESVESGGGCLLVPGAVGPLWWAAVGPPLGRRWAVPRVALPHSHPSPITGVIRVTAAFTAASALFLIQSVSPLTSHAPSTRPHFAKSLHGCAAPTVGGGAGAPQTSPSATPSAPRPMASDQACGQRRCGSGTLRPPPARA